MQLIINDVSKSFGGLSAVSQVDIKITTGEVHALIGPNGAGKTTLFNVISGIIKPDTGKICFGDLEIQNMAPHVITQLGIARTFQNIRIFKNLTVIENVMIGEHCRAQTGVLASAVHTPKKVKEEKKIFSKALEILEFVGISSEVSLLASQLPYGLQKRLELARALATEPKLILLDEPAAGMNQQETQYMIDLINRIKKLGKTILFIEHDMRLVMDISDEITVLNFGKKIAEGKPIDIQNNASVIEAYLGKKENYL
jgi:branched-chain amino acid transport system ATP-binding protein